MKNRIEIPGTETTVAALTRFFDELGFRCADVGENPKPGVCGAPAAYVRPGVGLLPLGFYCVAHRRDTDRPIPLEPIYRRVTVTLDVQLAGVSSAPAICHAEAVDRLLRAVELAGGTASVRRVTSAAGQYRPPTVRFEKRRRREG